MMSQRKIPEFVSVGFIAQKCGVSNTTVLRWIGTGELPAFRLPGGHYRIGMNDFHTFCERYKMPVGELTTATAAAPKKKNRKKSQ